MNDNPTPQEIEEFEKANPGIVAEEKQTQPLSQWPIRVALALLAAGCGAAIAYFFHAVGGPLPAENPRSMRDPNAERIIAYWKHESDIAYNLGFVQGEDAMMRLIFSKLDSPK